MADEQAEERPESRTTSAAERKGLLAELAGRIGAAATVEGDRVLVETGDPVAIYAEVEPGGTIGLTWWMTASSPIGHPRWRDAAAAAVQDGEAIYASALGGGFLAEVARRAATVDDAVQWVRDRTTIDRVHALTRAYGEALAALPPEPVPDELRPGASSTSGEA